MPGMRITGYIYRADIYCPACLGYGLADFAGEEDQQRFGETWKAMEGEGRDRVEEFLDGLAKDEGIDREDEVTFDSDDFPKVVLSLMDDGLACGACGNELD